MKTLSYHDTHLVIRNAHENHSNLSQYLHDHLYIANRLAEKIHSDYLTTGKFHDYWLAIISIGCESRYSNFMAAVNYPLSSCK